MVEKSHCIYTFLNITIEVWFAELHVSCLHNTAERDTMRLCMFYNDSGPARLKQMPNCEALFLWGVGAPAGVLAPSAWSPIGALGEQRRNLCCSSESGTKTTCSAVFEISLAFPLFKTPGLCDSRMKGGYRQKHSKIKQVNLADLCPLVLCKYGVDGLVEHSAACRCSWYRPRPN